MSIIVTFSIVLVGLSSLLVLAFRLIFRRSVIFTVFSYLLFNAALTATLGLAVGLYGTQTLFWAAPVGITSIGLSLLFQYRSVAKPLKHVAELLRSISEGEGDLTQRIRLEKRNEIGDLASHFNGFSRSLNGMILTMRGSTERASDVGARLAAVAEESNAALHQISVGTTSITDRTSVLDDTISATGTTVVEFREFLIREVHAPHQVPKRHRFSIRGRSLSAGDDEIPVDSLVVLRARRLAVTNSQNLIEALLEHGIGSHHVCPSHARQVV